MRDPKTRALSSASHWLNKCYDLGLTAEEVVARSVVNRKAVNRKEKETGKEKFPPHPLKEKRGKQRESSPSSSRARVCEEEKSGNPSYEQVEKFAATNGISQNFARAWYDRMNRLSSFRTWRHPKSGKKLNYWQSYLEICWRRRDEFDDAEPVETPKRPRIDIREYLKWGKK